MIGTPPDRAQDRDTDISFFTALASIVEASHLSHLEISRRANRKIRNALAKIEDPADRILLEIATQWLSRVTVYRAVNGKSSISKDTLSLIVSGLDLDEGTSQWLEELRKEEEHVHHSTQQRAIVTKTNKDPHTDELPRWIMEV